MKVWEKTQNVIAGDNYRNPDHSETAGSALKRPTLASRLIFNATIGDLACWLPKGAQPFI
jgi:hypothetical protein